MRRLGITATRNGLSEAQREAFAKIVKEYQPDEFHHGDCVGGDADGVAIVREIMGDRCKIVCHPPIKDDVRAFVPSDITHEPFSYFKRNRNIVDAVDFLFGGPPCWNPRNVGGTWYTINYALKVKKHVRYVSPDGDTEES